MCYTKCVMEINFIKYIMQNISYKMYHTKCITQNISHKMCYTKCKMKENTDFFGL